MSLKVKEVRLILTIYGPSVETVTGLWGMSTRSTSSRLYRGPNTLGTFGSVSGTQELHLLLSPRLEKHENKDHEREAAELTEGRVLVAVPAFEREGDILDENSSTVDDGRHDSKLDANL